MEGGENPDKPYWFVAGLDERALQALPLSLLSGRMPQNSAEVVVPLHAETNGGVAVSLGDMLSLALFERTDEGKRSASTIRSARAGDAAPCRGAELYRRRHLPAARL